MKRFLLTLRDEVFNAEIFKARLNRWSYLITQGLWRGECAYAIRDNQGLRLLGSGVPMVPGIFKDYRVWWERRVQLVRWIETRGCDAADYKTLNGVVIREYMMQPNVAMGYTKEEIFVEIRLENGDAVFFPKKAFYVAPDGVLEYRF
jgi:hypothetical protein